MKITRRMSTMNSRDYGKKSSHDIHNNPDVDSQKTKQDLRNEVLNIINDNESNNSLDNVVIVDADKSNSDVQNNTLPVLTEIDESIRIGDNLHMKLPDKDNEVDMHFNNIISNLD